MEQDININRLLSGVEIYHDIQPIVDVKKNKILGYEALLRSKTIKDPVKLFRYAQQNGHQFELDMHSICQAIRLLKCGIGGSYFYINVFPSTLLHDDFENRLQCLLNDLKPCTESIVFELSEAEKGTDLQKLKKAVYRLRKEGFLIALDDVGEGESNLKTIFEIEPDFVKVDRYFSMNLATEPKKQKLLRLLMKFFGKDTDIILEGIETGNDLLAVKTLGVPYVQGFYTGKPEPFRYYFGSADAENAKC